jgi:glycosyltransferase involved in cell wall biosynthesis
VVDDASTDGSLAHAVDWCERHPDVPVIVLHRGLNRGLAHARNAGVDFSRGEFVFILDADNQIYPHCLSRLVDVLDADADAVFAYGMSERFNDRGSTGLLSVGGWEPRRLRHVNYVDAMAIIRLDALRALGGYSDDMRLYGWEDYDLWCTVAERGWRGHAVREILGRYRVSTDSMLGSITNLSSTDAYVALIERHPQLMSGVTPPL